MKKFSFIHEGKKHTVEAADTYQALNLIERSFNGLLLSWRELQEENEIINDLTVWNATDYLSQAYFTEIQFLSTGANGELFFSALDEDGERKEIEFLQESSEKVIVSVKNNGQWIILEILEDDSQ